MMYMTLMRMKSGDHPLYQNNMKSNFLLIGDKKGKRLKEFVNCLKSENIYNYNIVTWQDLLTNLDIIKKHIHNNTIIKIEPPEKDLYLYKSFLKVGLKKGIVSSKEIDNIDFEKCPIIAPAQWYCGIKEMFYGIEDIVNANKGKNIFMTTNIKETLIMMDKKLTYDFLEENIKDFYLPKRLKNYKDYDEFREDTANKYLKCFIKLRYGSGSEGVIAYSNNPRLNEEIIYTSLNYSKEEKIFFSTYKVNCIKDKDIIKKMIDWVLENDAHIEMWIPKSKYKGQAYDTRVIVVNNKVEYLLSRLSKTPITNLHLRNNRLESERFIEPKNIEIIKKASESVMKAFNNSFISGIDVVMSTGNKPYIIDVNPFGDLLHHLIGTEKNIYYKEIEESIKKLGEIL
ncbi:hypothetical protein DP144_08155 [Clostridium tetani]|nr:hypothetical protein DP133_12600 [Clostridium tetani]RXM76241.1 hypothetical protein DP154_08150 [Clostridium tetani]RYU98903.1 hypothetical protein DP144_08155 [Clostridium tetani]